jgi:heat shock protein HtpX
VAGLVLATWLQLRYAGRQLVAGVDGSVVTDESHPELAERFRRLAALADVPTPRLVIAPTDAPNSFTVGRPGSATVVVTEGLLERLPDEEVDAVLAHELAHVLNRDAAVMTLLSVLPATLAGESPLFSSNRSGWTAVKWAAVVYVLTTLLLTGATLGQTLAASLAVFVVLVGLASIFLGLLTAPVLVLGYRLSWDREFVADRAAARLIGDPGALASAIGELREVSLRPATDARVHNDQLRPLCFLPFGDAPDTDSGAVPVDAPTHPPAEKRLERLRSVAADLEG